MNQETKTLLLDERMFGLYGVIIGYALSEITKWIGYSRKDREAAASSRSLLKIELERNAGILQELWSELQAPVESGIEEVVRCRRFIERPFPEFSTLALKSTYASLNKALSNQQIKVITSIYAQYETIENIHKRLSALDKEQTDTWNLASGGFGSVTLKGPFSIPRSVFNDKAPRYWTDLKKTTEAILNAQIPIK